MQGLGDSITMMADIPVYTGAGAAFNIDLAHGSVEKAFVVLESRTFRKLVEKIRAQLPVVLQ